MDIRVVELARTGDARKACVFGQRGAFSIRLLVVVRAHEDDALFETRVAEARERIVERLSE